MSDSDDTHVDGDDAPQPAPSAEGHDEARPRGGRGGADEVTVREGRQRKHQPEKSDEPGRRTRPRKQRKQRKQRRRPGRGSRERPAFLASFPKDPELAQVVAAFQRGDYATVRRRATRLAETAESKRVRQAARELLRRIDPDPLAKLLLAAALALLLFLAIWAYAAH